jgi:hypothetical protein
MILFSPGELTPTKKNNIYKLLPKVTENDKDFPQENSYPGVLTLKFEVLPLPDNS